MLLGALVPRTTRAWNDDLMVDRQSAQRMADGDAEVLARIYDRHIRTVFGLAMRILQNQGDSEDVVQGVFTQFWAQAKRHDMARGSIAPWLMTITRSRAIDRLRSRRIKPESDPAVGDNAVVEFPDPTVEAEPHLPTAESVSKLRSALSALPLLQRVAIELACFEGLTQTQIEERLEQPRGTVKTRIRAGLQKLRETLTV